MIWPFENDTSGITKKLAKNSLKSGKMRNILIILTISLSIALMSGLALYVASMQTANNRQLENVQQVFFYDITKQQCDTLRQDNRISEMRVTKYGKRSEIENYVIWPMLMYLTWNGLEKTSKLAIQFRFLFMTGHRNPLCFLVLQTQDLLLMCTRFISLNNMRKPEVN